MIRLQFPRTLFVALALVVSGCGDETSPASPDLPPADASVEISLQTLGFGTVDPLQSRTIVVRVLGEEGVVKREIVGVFSEDPNRILGPYQVPVGSQEAVSAHVEVEIAGIAGEARVVLWSARSSQITLLPGERVDVGLTLLRGGLELRGLTGLTITGVPSEIGIGEVFHGGVSASPDTPGLVPAWGALDPEVLAVDPQGRLRGVAVGVGRVVAAAGPVPDTVSVFVRSMVEHIEISPVTHTFESLGETMGLNATVLSFRGDTLPDQAVEWSASPVGVVSVSPSGVARASAVGVAGITASTEGVSTSISVEVTQVPARLVVSPSTLSIVPGEEARFSVRVLDALGSTIPGVPVTWASSDSSVVSVDSEGNVLGIGLGSADVLARAGLLQGSARVAVEVGEPASIIVTPPGGSIEPGQILQFSALVLDGAGNEVPGAVVSWSSGDPSLATVAGSGLVRGEFPGTVVIQAASGPATGSVEVVVTDPTADSLEIISGNGQTAPAGLQLPDSLHVRVLSPFGMPVPGVSVAWGPQDGGSAIPSPSVTDASGVARTEWVLGLGTGAQELEASIPGAMVTFEATASGASRVFDRALATDQVTVSSDPSGDFNFPNGDWTLAMWVRPDDLSGDFQYAFSGAMSPFAQGVNVYLNPDLGMRWTFSARGATSGGILGGAGGGAPAVVGEWQHLVVRRSGTTVRLWSNGSVIPIGSIEITEAANASGTPRLGVRGDLSGGWYSGGVAHVTRWSSALSPEELADLAAGVHALDVSPGTRDWFIPLGRDPESQVGGGFVLSVFGTTTGDAHPVAPPSTP
jgi:uncharacterized protein YjdB